MKAVAIETRGFEVRKGDRRGEERNTPQLLNYEQYSIPLKIRNSRSVSKYEEPVAYTSSPRETEARPRPLSISLSSETPQ